MDLKALFRRFSHGMEIRAFLPAAMAAPGYTAAAEPCRDTNVLRFALFLGLLLMTFPGSPLGASGTQDENALELTDFTTSTADFGWYVVNDNVMGGRSEGDFRIGDGELHFAGSTNTNGGGFSSIRTKPLDLDLSPYAGIRLRVKGDGRRYTWRLATDARWRGGEIGYWADFETRDGEWHTVDVPFSSFVPRFRGARLDGPELDLAEIRGMGLMIYDGRDGRFDLRLASVHAFSSPEEQQ